MMIDNPLHSSHTATKSMILTFLALIISILPVPLFGVFFVPWFWIMIFLWQTESNECFTPVYILCVSLIFDFFTNNLIGSTPLLMLIFAKMIHSNRFIIRGQDFQIKWAVFGFVSLVLTLFRYLLYSSIAMKFIDITPLLLSFAFLIIFYPIFAKIFNWFNNSYE